MWWYLSLIIFLPTVAALGIGIFCPKGNSNAALVCTLCASVAVVFLVLLMLIPNGPVPYDADIAEMQDVVTISWIPSFDIQYYLGLDGISFPLVVLTAVVTALSALASWSVTKQVKGYCILFLLLETGMLGVFMALDFFLFYVFWEVMLLPMYFLIGVWGGPRKEYAAIKFFLYTLVGSVFMLIAILLLYFNSDLTQLDAESLVAANVVEMGDSVSAQAAFELWRESDDAIAVQFRETIEAAARAEPGESKPQLHTFNMLALAEVGQNTDLFDGRIWGMTTQHWAFLLLFLGFIIKVPSVPLHTWLPDAHVKAPTPISMILAGILLKMGGYGIIRICYPMCPNAGYDFAWMVCLIGVVSMVYGAFAAMAQRDFKRLVAYSSVSHMGYVVLGLGVWSATAATNFDPDYWAMGVKGAMFQMIGHGISSAGMFFMVGVVYDRVHHRNLDEFGGLHGRMPVYTALAIGIFFAGLGLPGLCGFIGEVFVVLSVWKFSTTLAVISASVVILTAGYILWAIQRVYLGAEYKGPHGDALSPITARELWVAAPLLVLAILLGVLPHQTVLRYMDATIDRQVQSLAEWTETTKEPALARQRAEQEAEEARKRARSADADRRPSEQFEKLTVAPRRTSELEAKPDSSRRTNPTFNRTVRIGPSLRLPDLTLAN